MAGPHPPLRRFGATLVVALAAVLLGACSSEGGAGGSRAETGGAPGSATGSDTSGSPRSSSDEARAPGGGAGSAAAAAAPPEAQTGSGQAVTLVFGGDVHFEGPLRPLLQSSNATAALAPVRKQFEAADLAMVNFETAITERGTPLVKDYTFRAPASSLGILRDAGVDVVTVANNHGVDFGPVGLQDTLAAKDSGTLAMVGVGRNAAEAYAPWITTIKGQRIAVIGATQVIDTEYISSWTATDSQAGLASAKEEERLLAAVRDARTKADTVVVYLHWGTSNQTCPNTQQQALAPRLVDAGADVIVGGHAHRVVGGGRLGNAVVHYGLGNFVFYNQTGPAGDSGFFSVTMTGRRVDGYRWLPARLQGFVATPLSGKAADAAVTDWDKKRSCTSLTP